MKDNLNRLGLDSFFFKGVGAGLFDLQGMNKNDVVKFYAKMQVLNVSHG